jgi:hypothetical protein
LLIELWNRYFQADPRVLNTSINAIVQSSKFKAQNHNPDAPDSKKFLKESPTDKNFEWHIIDERALERFCLKLLLSSFLTRSGTASCPNPLVASPSVGINRWRYFVL